MALLIERGFRAIFPVLNFHRFQSTTTRITVEKFMTDIRNDIKKMDARCNQIDALQSKVWNPQCHPKCKWESGKGGWQRSQWGTWMTNEGRRPGPQAPIIYGWIKCLFFKTSKGHCRGCWILQVWSYLGKYNFKLGRFQKDCCDSTRLA